MFLALSKIENTIPFKFKKPLSSNLCSGVLGVRRGVGLCTTGGLGFCEPGLIKGFCPLRRFRYIQVRKKIKILSDKTSLNQSSAGEMKADPLSLGFYIFAYQGLHA